MFQSAIMITPISQAGIRPSFNAMLDYVRKSKIDGVVVIIDDISRFARDIEGHWTLRRALKETGGTLETADGLLVHQ